MRYHRGMSAHPPATYRSRAPLPAAFFERAPALVAPDLLGAVVVSVAAGTLVAGRIVETEAYLGSDDPGSHAATRGITRRNAVMYGPPGAAYVYFTYGNHFMLNLVCEPEGVAGGVLLRAIEPLAGLEVMEERRGGRTGVELTNGPGKLAAALGLDLSDNGVPLGIGRLQVYHGERLSPERVEVSGRIGLTAGHELDLRFFVRGDPYVSRGRTGLLRKSRRDGGPVGREGT